MSDPSTPGNPYGEPANPYGQPQPPQQQPPVYAQPQAQPPAYGQAQPQYGQPGYYGQPGLPDPDADKRPGPVTAAAVLTLVFSGLTLALFVFAMLGLVVERDAFLEELDNEPGLEDVSANDLFAVLMIVLGVFLLWSLIAIVLAILVMRRSNAARILLIISAAMTALFSLLAIMSAVSAATLVAGISVVVMLLTGSARDWFARKNAPPQMPLGTTQPWG
jgi:hypothetical protein